jgi:hypothetical protein
MGGASPGNRSYPDEVIGGLSMKMLKYCDRDDHSFANDAAQYGECQFYCALNGEGP